MPVSGIFRNSTAIQQKQVVPFDRHLLASELGWNWDEVGIDRFAGQGIFLHGIAVNKKICPRAMPGKTTNSDSMHHNITLAIADIPFIEQWQD